MITRLILIRDGTETHRLGVSQLCLEPDSITFISAGMIGTITRESGWEFEGQKHTDIEILHE